MTFIRKSDGIIPSYLQGFARNASESQNPGLWKGITNTYAPFLGRTGNQLFDWGGRKRNGVINGATWVPGPALSFDGNDVVEIDGVIPDIKTSPVGAIHVRIKPTDISLDAYYVSVSRPTIEFDFFQYVGSFTSGKVLAALFNIGQQWRLETDDVVLTNGVWTDIEIVHDGVAPVLYVDGVKPAQTFLDSTDTTQWWADIGVDGQFNTARIGRLHRCR